MQLNEPRYAGRLPSLTAVLRLPARERLAWGRELGRRFRDEVRIAESEGVGVDAWQFDELVAELSGAQGRAWREFTRGTLHGLTFGRSELGDGPRIALSGRRAPASASPVSESTPSCVRSGVRWRPRPSG
jgi:hypothetical protein